MKACFSLLCLGYSFSPAYVELMKIHSLEDNINHKACFKNSYKSTGSYFTCRARATFPHHTWTLMSKLNLNRLNCIIQRRTSSPLKTKIHKKPRPPVLAQYHLQWRERLHSSRRFLQIPFNQIWEEQRRERGGRTSISKHKAVRCFIGIRVGLECCI